MVYVKMVNVRTFTNFAGSARHVFLVTNTYCIFLNDD